MASPGLPPHDLGAEAAVMVSVLLYPAAIDEVLARVQPEQFYSEAHRRIFEAAVELHAKGQPMDIVAVASRLQTNGRLQQVGGTDYLRHLVEDSAAVPISHVAAHANVVRDKARMRAAIAVCQRVSAEGYLHTGDVQEFLDGAEHAVHEVARSFTESRMESYGAVALRVGREALSVAAGRGRIAGASTGFPSLDAMTLGLRPGRLYMLAARPGIGKTALAMNIAHHVASEPGQHVPFFTLEMENDELGTRGLCATANIDSMKLGMGEDIGYGGLERLDAAIRKAASVNLHLCDDPNINAFAMRAFVRRIRSTVEPRGERVALVVADYLQLMESPARRKNENREQEVAGISRSLKKLAKELRCPVLALSQLNRGLEARGGPGARPRLSDLRESGALEQDADVVMLIHKPPPVKGPLKMTPSNIHELILAKVRGGRRGIVLLDFDKPSTRFSEMTAERAYDDAHESIDA